LPVAGAGAALVETGTAAVALGVDIGANAPPPWFVGTRTKAGNIY